MDSIFYPFFDMIMIVSEQNMLRKIREIICLNGKCLHYFVYAADNCRLLFWKEILQQGMKKRIRMKHTTIDSGWRWNMFPVIIRNHSPMDDYRKIQSQIKYTIQYAPNVTVIEKPDRKEKLTGNKSYKIAYKAVIAFLILTGIGIIIAIIAGFTIFRGPITELERKIFLIMVIAPVAFLGISLLLCGVGAPIELRAERKDRTISISLDCKTWILNNGQVVISDEQRYRSMQKCDSKTIQPISEAPFKQMIIIYKVYTITRINGRIIADADIRELYRKHPYVNDGSTRSEEEDVDRVYYYCQKDKRDKVIWYENMYGRERLLEALNEMM